ncbi:MAG: hypothetical protein ACKO2P_17030 [Planctomycetota bacterium]
MKGSEMLIRGTVVCLLLSTLLNASASADEPFRPVAGQFPPIEKALAYRGELVFADHVNRRGSLRVQGEGTFFRNAPHPFAMLPYGVISYHGAPAELRDIPLGTVLHVRAFLPPDPKISAVPVLPINNRERNAGYIGAATAPAENHLLLLEDEPSHCLREGRVWKLESIDLQGSEWILAAARVHRDQALDAAGVEKMTLDPATRIWRGRELLNVADLISDGTWTAGTKFPLNSQAVWLGITWKPTPSGVFTRFHVSDLWLDETAMQRAIRGQSEQHKALIRSRWMPAWIDAVEYGRFGRATITATLFGGMDAELYADFRKDVPAMMNASENTLKHVGGAYGPAHMASRGSLLDVSRVAGPVPLGSSGLQIRFETDLIIEGIRPGRIVRVRPGNWPQVDVPREEYLGDGSFSHEDRFPTPAIFPKY